MRDALSASRLFSGLVETRVVRFAVPAAPAAPRKIHAVVLTFDGLLWLYTPGLGTRSLGAAPADTAVVNAEIVARLRRLEPAVCQVEVYEHPLLPSAQEISGSLRNGCFAGCLFELARLLARDEQLSAAGVVFFSPHRAGEGPAGRSPLLDDVGHAVLVYCARDRWWALDPAQPEKPLPLRGVQLESAIDPALAGHALRVGYPLRRVTFLAFSREALAGLRREARWRAFRESSPSSPG